MATMKQRAAAKKILENPGKAVSRAMEEVGYDSNTAKNPSDLTNSKGWAELMEEYFPDDFLATKHKALLNKKEHIAIGKVGEREVLSTGELDANAVGKGLDMAYKLKGKYAAEKIKIEDAYENMTDEEIDTRLVEMKSKQRGGE